MRLKKHTVNLKLILESVCVSVAIFATVPLQSMAFPRAFTRALGEATSRRFLNIVPSSRSKRTRRPHLAHTVRVNNFGWLPSGTKLTMSSEKEMEDKFRQKQKKAHQKFGESSMTDTSDNREEHAKRQAHVFDEQSSSFASGEMIPDDVVPVLRHMAQTMLHGTAASREKSKEELVSRPARANVTYEEDVYHVLDVGCGTGALFDYYVEVAAMSEQTVHIHGLDLSPKMVARAQIHGQEILKKYPRQEHTIDVEVGDICDWEPGPSQQYDLVVANACFGNFFDRAAALKTMTDATRLDGWLCITHPLGSEFVHKLHQDDPSIVPHELPTYSEFKKMARTLPLRVLGVADKHEDARGSSAAPTFYMACAIKTVHRTLPEIMRLRGKVADGYGRGGKKLGFATANLPSSLFQKALEDIPCGVYFGWAVLEGQGKGRKVAHKAAVNVGYSPTFEGQENKEKIVEAHLILERDVLDPPDFYGETMRLQLGGFIRGEIKFPSFPDLMKQIKTDVEDAREALDLEIYQTLAKDPFLNFIEKEWVGSGGGDISASWEFEDVETILEREP